MNREALERPFDPSLIKTRQGGHGRSLSYVEGVEYIRRLNEVYDADWNFEIVQHQVLEGEVIVVGKLVAGGVIKMSFGGSSVTTSRSTGEVVSLADDLKAAATDALKKACSLLGIGLHLYSDAQPSAGSGNGRQQPHGGNGIGQHRGNGNGRGNGASNGDRATQRQVSAIWALGRNLGLSADIIRQRSIEEFGAMPEMLSKSDASALISAMKAELNGGDQGWGGAA